MPALAQQARSPSCGSAHAPFFNTLLWVVDKEGDLPDWLTVNNPRLRHIPARRPDQTVRRLLVPALLRDLPGSASIASASATPRA